MLYPPRLAVLKSEGGGLAEGNMQVGGEPPEKQIILLFDPESLARKPFWQKNERPFITKGKWNVPMMSSCGAAPPGVAVSCRDAAGRPAIFCSPGQVQLGKPAWQADW